SSGSFTASWRCSASLTYKVNYANTPPGTTSVTVSYTGSGALASGSITNGVPPDPGSLIFSATGPSTASGGTITANPSSATLSLAGSPSC
ncbi:MAG: hypothetical protein ABI970_08390, partial [Chloroflexota bacterium]